MKKIILFAGLLFAGLTQAQVIEVTTTGNTPIEDGQVFTFNSLGANLPLVVSNVSNQPINLKLRMDSMENANGNSEYVSFCFWQSCYFTVIQGGMVPASGPGMPLAAGETTTTDNHFANSYAGDTSGQPVTYNLSIVQVDDNGAVMGDALISFTYKYQPTMAVNDLASLTKMGITVNNTTVKDMLNLNASQPATMEVYGLNGKLLKTASLVDGAQSIDLSGLSAAIYIAKFTTAENRSSSIRIVKQ